MNQKQEIQINKHELQELYSEAIRNMDYSVRDLQGPEFVSYVWLQSMVAFLKTKGIDVQLKVQGEERYRIID